VGGCGVLSSVLSWHRSRREKNAAASALRRTSVNAVPGKAGVGRTACAASTLAALPALHIPQILAAAAARLLPAGLTK